MGTYERGERRESRNFDAPVARLLACSFSLPSPLLSECRSRGTLKPHVYEQSQIEVVWVSTRAIHATERKRNQESTPVSSPLPTFFPPLCPRFVPLSYRPGTNPILPALSATSIPPARSASFLSLNCLRYFRRSNVTTATTTSAMTDTPAKTPRPMGWAGAKWSKRGDEREDETEKKCKETARTRT